MLKIDIISGFLGAGKTTFIERLLKTNIKNEKVVLIENEFGEVSVDSDILRDTNIDIKELSQGCICCSLVGDFAESLSEVIEKFNPDRIIIEPSGVGKLTDVKKAIIDAGLEDCINSLVCLVDVSKAKVYARNFGEFFIDQIENAYTVVLSRCDVQSLEKKNKAIEIVRSHNEKCVIVTTPINELSDDELLKAYEGFDVDLLNELKEELEHEHHHHHEEECCCGGHHEHHHHHEEECCCGGHHEHHHHHEEECCCGGHHEHHHHHEEECCCGGHHEHHHHHEEECCCGGHHEHHHHHEEECCCGGHHEHHHHHEEECCCGGHHEHHHHHEEECCCGGHHKHHHHHEEECCCGGHHEHHHHHEEECCCGGHHEHHHHHEEECCCGGHHEHHHHHGHHHADEVFSSIGIETPKKFDIEALSQILDAMAEGRYGLVVRAKGIICGTDNKWYMFNLTPGEVSVVETHSIPLGKICVIGSKINEEEIKELF